MSNRITDYEDRILAKIPGIDKEKLEAMDKGLKTPLKDLIDYQNLQAQAHAMGKISYEEADYVYNALGRESVSTEKWDKLPLETKAAITALMSELLDWKIKGAKAGTKFTVDVPAVTMSSRKPTKKKTNASIGGSR